MTYFIRAPMRLVDLVCVVCGKPYVASVAGARRPAKVFSQDCRTERNRRRSLAALRARPSTPETLSVGKGFKIPDGKVEPTAGRHDGAPAADVEDAKGGK